MSGALKKGLKSWKTTAAGWAAAVGLGLTEVSKFLDGDPSTEPQWGLVIGAFAVLVGFTMARDGDKSSEEVGAK